MHNDAAHEERVAAFFNQRQREMPHFFAEVCERYPVLSEEAMRWDGRRHETPISLFEDDEVEQLWNHLYSTGGVTAFDSDPD